MGSPELLMESANRFKSIIEDLNDDGVIFECVSKKKEGKEQEDGGKASAMIRETDPLRLKNRQKQIEFGYNTRGYQNYLLKYPDKRLRPTDAPKTPNKRKMCSARSWAGQIKKWRRDLHNYDDEKAK